MNISCEVIKDLLPLYHDDVCSNESKTIVEEHLKDCESCKAYLYSMDVALPAEKAQANLKEAEAVQNLSKRWKRGMWKSLIKGILITLAVVAVLFIILYTFMDFRII